jgi:hypothetical protein
MPIKSYLIDKSKIKQEVLDRLLGKCHTAEFKVTVNPVGAECAAEVVVGSYTSGLVPFTSTGKEQTITCPITIPDKVSHYPTYINIYNGFDQKIFACMEGQFCQLKHT